MDRPQHTLSSLLTGGLAGAAATVPMTAVMEVMKQWQPPQERYRLPPIAITTRAAAKVGLEEHVHHSEWSAVSLAAHFGYGASMGALYAATRQTIRPPFLLGGAIYGLALWAGGYLGWVPALGLYRRSTQQPRARRMLNVWSHVVYGMVLHLLLDRLWPAHIRRG
ncbi:MAG TPA: DUF1440 domain-containing protein, partial [Chloroflexota bacterium]|nr:DUF1440 domain-containing protein [Chloroflexota bacterium]